MELLISIDRGMPSGSAMIPAGNETVLNIDDGDLPAESGSTVLRFRSRGKSTHQARFSISRVPASPYELP